MKGLFTTRTAALKATIIDGSKIYAKNVILNGENIKDKFDNLEQIIRELEIKRPKISNVSFTFGEIKNGSIEHLSFVDGEIIATIDTKFHLIQMTIDGERVSSPILKTENGWVVRVYEVDASEEDISFLYPNLTDDSEFSLLFVSSGDDIDNEGGTGGGLCDCEPFELTAEAVQKVVPMAWLTQSLRIGENAKGLGVGGTVVGSYAETKTNHGTAFGFSSTSDGLYSVGMGYNADVTGGYAVALGSIVQSKAPTSVTVGSKISDTSGNYTCTTEGTGSITIGAGANTKNTTKTVDGVETTVESSNSVTIGCKALNQGADSVVIGASASNSAAGGVTIGANAQGWGGVIIGNGAKDVYRHMTNIAIGLNAETRSIFSTAVGSNAISSSGAVSIGKDSYSFNLATAIGQSAKANANSSIAIGCGTTVSDLGATVIRSTAEDGTYTQLYFSGANTPLAIAYENGEAMMGYVTMQKNAEGKFEPVAAGTNKLSALFPNNSTFQPATLDEFGEWIQPKVFHPSDLDLPIEEPIEEEEYQPLPVYPIVEPEIDELMIQE